MRYFVRRRLRNVAALLIAIFAVWMICRWQANAIQHDSFTTGYLLLLALFFLAAYGVRKKIPVLPIGNASTWFQVHIYVGLGSIFVFLSHIGFHLPNGVFESVLAGVFVLVAASGVLGLYLSRTVAKKISRLPDEYIFERIPRLRHRVSVDARNVVCGTTAVAHANVLAGLYADELAAFFERPRELWFQLFPASGRRRKLMGKLSAIQRFCSPAEKQASEQLFSLIRKKDDLDYHYSLQLLLKSWVFLHVAMTYSLLILAMLHGLMAHAFRGSV